MPAIPPQQVQLACPSCRTPIQTTVYSLIDVQEQPELKQALLSGQLNVVVCSNCGFTSMLGTPLLYHDAQQQLCLVYVPQELNLAPDEQEKAVGELTNLIMQSLPPGAPKGYLLTPRRFMSLGSLIDAVLEADGIPREVLEQQRQRVDLLGQLASTLEDDAQLVRLVEQHRERLDPEFFATLGAFIDASAQEGRDESVELLTRLQDRLIELTGFQPGATEPDTAAAIERLQQVDDAELEQAVAELRPLIDYSFFEAWTARIEELEQAGQTALAQQLTARRTRILEIVEQMDQAAQALFEAGADILREALTAPDPRPVLEARHAELGEALLLVLEANIAAAQRGGQADLVARLDQIKALATEIIEAQLSPEERFINTLLTAENPQESTRLLRQNVGQVTPELVKQLNELADEQEQRGAQQTADRLRQLAREAGAMLF